MVDGRGAVARSVTLAVRQALYDHMKRFASLAAISVPKQHMLYHLLRGLRSFGNPRMYACFLDESLNKQLKHAAKHCHARNFDKALLLRMQWLLCRVSENRKRKRD